MNIKHLHSFGKKDLEKYVGELPELQAHQFIVKSKYTGICRNDISQYAGQGFIMPVLRFGHETVGYITKVHDEYIGKFKIGDLVSTFDSDPGFGEYFYSDDTRTVLIPELSPKYIMEPVACAINLIIKTITTIIGVTQQDVLQPRLLLIGSGFMSLLIKQYCGYIGIDIEIAGQHHKKDWERLGVNLKPFQFYIDKRERFDGIIDLSGHTSYHDQIISDLTENGAVICIGSGPKPGVLSGQIVFDFSTSAWKDLTYIFPSPRTKGFIDVMELCVKLIESNILQTDFLWSKGYNFDDLESCKLGFEDGLNRTEDYFKGYIKF